MLSIFPAALIFFSAKLMVGLIRIALGGSGAAVASRSRPPPLKDKPGVATQSDWSALMASGLSAERASRKSARSPVQSSLGRILSPFDPGALTLRSP